MTNLIDIAGLGKSFDRVAKSNRLNLTRNLGRLLIGRPPLQVEGSESRFHALKDINLTVKRGEAVGVIGHNGAGKSTLLRVLAGEYLADEGSIQITGTRGALIDLTGGFSTELSGRENIYFRGAYLGFSREHLRKIEDEIVDFAEIGEFIDAEVKNYSSGMLLRLGFAINVLLAPDILLVDEIIAVGDFMFASKCMRKMNELRSNTAIVFVTHSMEIAVQFCDRLMVLDRGECIFTGPPDAAAAVYYDIENRKQLAGGSRLSRGTPRPAVTALPSGEQAQADIATDEAEAPVALKADEKPLTGDVSPDSAAPPSETEPETPPVVADVTSVGQDTTNVMVLHDAAEAPINPGEAQASLHAEGNGHSFGWIPAAVRASMHDFTQEDEGLTDLALEWRDVNGTPLVSIMSGDPVTLNLRFRPLAPIHRLVIGVPVYNEAGNLVTAFGTQGKLSNLGCDPGVMVEINLDIRSLLLVSGTYYPVVAIVDAALYLHRRPMPTLLVTKRPPGFEWGYVNHDFGWRILKRD